MFGVFRRRRRVLAKIARIVKRFAPSTRHKMGNVDEVPLQPISVQVLGGYGTLAVLPPELRHIIYRQLIAQGHIEVLAVSQAINEEASDFIFRDGILHLDFGNPGNSETPRIPSQLVVENIQNVVMRVDNRHFNVFNVGWCIPRLSEKGLAHRSTCGHVVRRLEILRPFAGSGMRRRTCCVIFEVWMERWKMVVEEMLEALRSFVGFEEVVVEIRLNAGDLDGSLYKFEVSREKDLRPPHGSRRTREVEAVVRMYRGMNVVRNFLVPTLGPVMSTLVEKTATEVTMRQRYSPCKKSETVVVEESARFWADWCADSWSHPRNLATA